MPTEATSPAAPSPETSSAKRRRVRVAESTVQRVRHQRERFATDYGKATTAQERFAAASNALRGAAAPGAHQVADPGLAARLDRLTDLMTSLLTELHEAQAAAAAKTIRDDQKRIERNERRRCDGRSRTHPKPTHPDNAASGTAGTPA